MPSVASPKKEVVLAIGLDKSTTEIVAAAKSRGVPVSRSYVELVKKGRTSWRTPKKTPTEPTASPGAPALAGTKKDFVLSHPSLTTAELIAAAATAGFTLRSDYVYLVRGDAKREGHSAPSEGSRPTPTNAPEQPAQGVVAERPELSAVSAFRSAAATLVIELGADRVHAMLSDVVARVRASVAAQEFG